MFHSFYIRFYKLLMVYKKATAEVHSQEYRQQNTDPIDNNSWFSFWQVHKVLVANKDILW